MKADIKKATITGENKDEFARPVQSIEYFERKTEAEIIFPYGVHANLPDGALMIALPVLNQSSNLVAFGGSPEKRIQVEQGEVVFFHPVTKAKIYFKNNGDIEIDSLDKDINVSLNNGTITASGNVTINVSGDVNLTADGVLNVTVPNTNWTGDISLDGEMTIGGIPFSTHTHTYDKPTHVLVPNGNDTGVPE